MWFWRTSKLLLAKAGEPSRLCGGMEVRKRLKVDDRTKTIPVVSDLVQGRARPAQQLQPGREQLHPEAGRLQPVPRDVKTTGLYWLLINQLPVPNLRSEPVKQLTLTK